MASGRESLLRPDKSAHTLAPTSSLILHKPVHMPESVMSARSLRPSSLSLTLFMLDCPCPTHKGQAEFCLLLDHTGLSLTDSERKTILSSVVGLKRDANINRSLMQYAQTGASRSTTTKKWRSDLEKTVTGELRDTIQETISKVLGERDEAPEVTISFLDLPSEEERQKVLWQLKTGAKGLEEICTCSQKTGRRSQPLIRTDHMKKKEIEEELAEVGGGWVEEDNVFDDDPQWLERLRLAAEEHETIPDC